MTTTRAAIEQEPELVSRLRQEAQIHAQEARTANHTIAEIYQICTGGTGEPGNWHGAEPVREYVESLLLRLEAAEQRERVYLSAMQGVVEMAKQGHALWDADQDSKVGKGLLALSGFAPRYDDRADALHAALALTIDQGEKK